jgi:uncharacterized protein (DUF608 family)
LARHVRRDRLIRITGICDIHPGPGKNHRRLGGWAQIDRIFDDLEKTMPSKASEFIAAGLKLRQSESGLPLGGIGAGSIEFCRDGRFTNVTTNNNWDSPIVDHKARIPPLPRIKEGFEGSVAENIFRRQSIFSAEGVPGAWLGIHTPDFGGRVLKTVGRKSFVPIDPDSIHFEGRFPYARVHYDGLDPIELQLETFSPFDLPDASEGYANSSLPLALFHITAKNPTESKLPVTLAFSWQNLNGLGGYAGTPLNDPDPTSPAFREDDFASGLWFDHADQSASDLRVLGDFSLRSWTDDPNEILSYCLGWDPDGDGRDVWEEFARDGAFSNQTLPSTAGALAMAMTLDAGEERSVVFALAWNMPHLMAAVAENETLVAYSSPPPDPRWIEGSEKRPDYGHAYKRWHENSWGVAEFGLRNWETIRERIFAWQGSLAESNVPDFFVEAACNDLFPMVSNTWYTLDGKFSVNEAPTDMKGCMGTIDQRAVANAVAACAFPGLDRSELEMFAADQVGSGDDPRQFGFHWNTTTGRLDFNLDREGSILHDVGWDHLEGGRTGKDGWLSAHWPDLSSVFVLQVYQHGIWNGASDWLQTMYPHVKAALRFQERLDQNGNGVADVWGSGCCTYDTELYPYYGSSPFIATLYLAALRAAERMALDNDDQEFVDEVRKRFMLAQGVLEEELWHDELGYYRSWIDPDHLAWENTPKAHDHESLNCHIGQLAGVWWADLLDLGEIIDPDRRRRATARITELNVDRVDGCPANEVDTEGGYSESWPLYALVYYSAQAISAGLADEGWRGVENIYRVRQQIDGSHWDSPLEYSGENNIEPQWGRWYMSTPASWYLWIALSGVRLDRVRRQMSVRPSWPDEWGEKLSSVPVFLPNMQLQVDCGRTAESWSLNLTVEKILGGSLDLDLITSQLPDHLDPKKTRLINRGVPETNISIKDDGSILIQGPLQFEKKGDGFSLEASVA